MEEQSVRLLGVAGIGISLMVIAWLVRRFHDRKCIEIKILSIMSSFNLSNHIGDKYSTLFLTSELEGRYGLRVSLVAVCKALAELERKGYVVEINPKPEPWKRLRYYKLVEGPWPPPINPPPPPPPRPERIVNLKGKL